MAYRLPDYIGFPGQQYSVSRDTKNKAENIANDPMEFENQMLKTLQIAEMRPVVPQATKDLNIYGPDLVEGWQKFNKYLIANDISLNEKHNQMKGFKVVLSNIIPLSESYTNSYGESELFGGLQNMASGGASEIAQITDISNGKEFLEDLQKDKKGFLGTLAKGIENTVEGVGSVAEKLTGSATIANGLKHLMYNPTHKISIPMMWKGCSFQASYQITTRLYCYNPGNNDLYSETILAPLAVLMMFALPRSTDDGKFYFTPFMMDFKIPGQVHIPMAYCASLDVVKGGDINDISWVKRPGTIDVRMNIGTVYGVKTNSLLKPKGSNSPTIMDELTTLYMIDNADQNIKDTLDQTGFSDAQNQEVEDSKRHMSTPQADNAALALEQEYGDF